jgi:hypothetical protein
MMDEFKYQLRWVIERHGNFERAKKSELEHAVLGLYKKNKEGWYMWIADFTNQEELSKFLAIKELPKIDEPLEG